MNTHQAIVDAIREADLGFYADMARNAVLAAAAQYERPSVLFRPRLYLDGNMYCALYGDDLMSGCAGFGRTADAAMEDFDKNWRSQEAPKLTEGK